MCPEDAPTVLRNKTVLNNLPSDVYSVEANEKIPDDCRYPFSIIQAAQNQKQTNIGVLAKPLQLKIGDKVILTINIDIQNHLINGQVGEVTHIDIVRNNI